ALQGASAPVERVVALAEVAERRGGRRRVVAQELGEPRAPGAVGGERVRGEASRDRRVAPRSLAEVATPLGDAAASIERLGTLLVRREASQQRFEIFACELILVLVPQEPSALEESRSGDLWRSVARGGFVEQVAGFVGRTLCAADAGDQQQRL